MFHRFPFTDRVSVECSLCGRVELLPPVIVAAFQERLNPSPPKGWFLLGRALICDSHDLRIAVDGADRSSWTRLMEF